MLDVETLSVELRGKLEFLLQRAEEIKSYPNAPNSIILPGINQRHELFSICRELDPSFGPYGMLCLRGIREYMIERMVD